MQDVHTILNLGLTNGNALNKLFSVVQTSQCKISVACVVSLTSTHPIDNLVALVQLSPLKKPPHCTIINK